MSDSTSDQSSKSLLRHAAPRLALLALGIAAFLFLGERWLTARALARAVARVEALELRVGGPHFRDAPGKDARAWITEVAAARRSGLHVTVVLQDGTLPEALCVSIACRKLETRLSPLAATSAGARMRSRGSRRVSTHSERASELACDADELRRGRHTAPIWRPMTSSPPTPGSNIAVGLGAEAATCIQGRRSQRASPSSRAFSSP
jgi:hypothetical protein